MAEHEQSKQTAATFENEHLSLEDIQGMESEIVRRIAMRFLTPEERSGLLAPGPSFEAAGGEGARFYGWDRGDNFDRDPHDKDPHDKDIHDRDNFDRGNFDRI